MVFPAPVEPTTPVVFPASNVNENPSNSASRSEYAKATSSRTSGLEATVDRSGSNVPCLSTMGASKTSSTRVDDAMAR